MAIYDPNSNQHSDGSDSIAQAKPYKRMKTIDCTPTWEGLLPMLLELYEAKAVKPAKRAETRREMGIELRRMAQAADKWNAHVKAMEAGKMETLGELPWEKDTEGDGKG